MFQQTRDERISKAKRENGEGKWRPSPESWRRRKRTMSLLPSLSEGLRALLRKARVEVELDEELRGFLEMAAKEKMEQG
jgi:ribosomal 50S subunit-associated protein YjgA (DUF615 family)